MKRSKVFSGFFVMSLVLCFFLASANAVEITGCIEEDGEFSNVAVGSSPSESCEDGGTEITLNTAGSQGPAGPGGSAGPQGDPGTNGTNGTNGLNGAAGAPGTNGTDGADGSSAPVFQFVGTTSVSFKGGEGVSKYSQQCNADHPGSRMCNSREFMETVAPPTIPLGRTSWIHTSEVIRIEREDNPTVSGTGPRFYIMDYSGLINGESFQSLTCNGWANGVNGFGGLVVQQGGKFGIANCSSTLETACCAPVSFD